MKAERAPTMFNLPLSSGKICVRHLSGSSLSAVLTEFSRLIRGGGGGGANHFTGFNQSAQGPGMNCQKQGIYGTALSLDLQISISA